MCEATVQFLSSGSMNKIKKSGTSQSDRYDMRSNLKSQGDHRFRVTGMKKVPKQNVKEFN